MGLNAVYHEDDTAHPVKGQEQYMRYRKDENQGRLGKNEPIQKRKEHQARHDLKQYDRKDHKNQRLCLKRLVADLAAGFTLGVKSK